MKQCIVAKLIFPKELISIKVKHLNGYFFITQVKQWAIITYKHGIYEFLGELPNDLRLRILGN